MPSQLRVTGATAWPRVHGSYRIPPPRTAPVLTSSIGITLRVRNELNTRGEGKQDHVVPDALAGPHPRRDPNVLMIALARIESLLTRAEDPLAQPHGAAPIAKRDT